MKDDLRELVEMESFFSLWDNVLAKPILIEYVRFAVNLYQEYFDKKIAELIALFPPDYVDSKGKLFWISPKRPPVNLVFDKNNENHFNFVLTTVKIMNSILPL